MQYVRLGQSGLRVSRICLGTVTFSREADETTSQSILDRYIELGGNFVDTADGYSDGASETVIGGWLKQRGARQDIVLATKVYARMGPGPNDGGLSRLHILRAVEASLRRLQTDVIDLYQIHRWDPLTPVEETLEALDDLVRQGKVRYIACSNLAAWQLSKYLYTSEQRFWSRFVSLQPVYNALNRGIENELLPLCEAAGLGVIVYNPLAGGVLTGKYRPGTVAPQGTRLASIPDYRNRFLTDESAAIVECFVETAREHGIRPVQLALAWVLAEPRVTCPIVGARNPEQLEETLGGLEFDLTPAERAAVPAALPGRWFGTDPVYDRVL